MRSQAAINKKINKKVNFLMNPGSIYRKFVENLFVTWLYKNFEDLAC